MISSFPLLQVSDKAAAGQCNGEATVSLSIVDEAPCSAVTISAVGSITARSVLVDWTYPNGREVAEFVDNFSFDDLMGMFFPTALDQFVGTSSRVAPHRAKELFQSCQAIYTTFDNPDTPSVSVWGFEQRLTNRNTGETTRRCSFVGGGEILRLTMSDEEVAFRLRLGLAPGETYEVRIRPFTVLIRPSALFDLRFGPISNVEIISALDAPPEGSIIEFKTKSREEDRMVLEWIEPLVPNGVITRYIASASDGESPPRIAASESPIPGKPANPTVHDYRTCREHDVRGYCTCRDIGWHQPALHCKCVDMWHQPR